MASKYSSILSACSLAYLYGSVCVDLGPDVGGCIGQDGISAELGPIEGSLGPNGIAGDIGDGAISGTLGPNGLTGDIGNGLLGGSLGPNGLAAYIADIIMGSIGPNGIYGNIGNGAISGSLGPDGLKVSEMIRPLIHPSLQIFLRTDR